MEIVFQLEKIERNDEKPIIEREPDISLLSPIVFKGHINYTNDFNTCAMICDNIITEIERQDNDIVPIGFDLEWPFSFQTGSGKTALAQICLSDTVCHLLHIYSLKTLPAAFVVLLSHPKIKLVGVNIKNDVWKLGRDFKEFPAEKVVENNCMDSGTFANRTFNRSCRWSLEKLTAYLLKKKIDKNRKVRMSQWHIHPLSKDQKIYAATDAYVSWLLHKVIQDKANAINNEENLKHVDNVEVH
ncbi:WRN RecQ like helicase isoform X2 [Nomia melanderi]|uniref:WRN RecQ like helicase isoform X2 n=1 Tax=Nomia melanderi TaxID=2448451 RepID=UPI0013042E0B|nr:Werner Syndrome-like exonuclease isoform X2 [Nomia melanderi]XP_031845842.1 Werner Syndrome-like exonuclease isoform X2 [Nomia melanderi]